MNLIIDAGNTAVKLAVFEEGQLILTQHVGAVYQDFKAISEEYPQINSVLISEKNKIKNFTSLIQLFFYTVLSHTI